MSTETDTITEFWGEHRFLSNFWPAAVLLDGIEMPTVEHAYQAAKTLDADWRARIASEPRPGRAKNLGTQAPVRPGWSQMRVDVMRDLLAQKFANRALAERLTATGTAPLVEGNTWGDQFWGVSAGVGSNHLGNLLMVERARRRGIPLPRLALDLEGTLVSNAVSLFARPGLYDFLAWTESRFVDRVLFTSVPVGRAASALALLVSGEEAPPSTSEMEVVSVGGGAGARQKDLRLVDSDIGHLLLVDDQPTVVLDAQIDRWVPIAPWNSPYPDDDDALVTLRRDLEAAVARLEGAV